MRYSYVCPFCSHPFKTNGVRGNIDFIAPDPCLINLATARCSLMFPWEHNGVQYPANWLRLSTEQDRAELGIVWVNADPTWNQKWYWGYDADGNLIPKTYTDLKALWIAQDQRKPPTSCCSRLIICGPSCKRRTAAFPQPRRLTTIRLGALGVPPSGLSALRW